MGAVNARFALQSSPIGRSFQNEARQPTRALGANFNIMLMVQDRIRRYSVEGMVRALDLRVSIRSTTRIEDVESFFSGQLLLSSSDAVEPIPAETSDYLRRHDVRLLILVDSAVVVDQSWADKAHGFVDWTDLCPETLREAIIDLDAGRFHVSPALALRSVTSRDRAQTSSPSTTAASVSALTARELDVLRLIAEGLTNRQIARSLSMSEHGIKRAVGIILAKLNCPNRTLAVVRAIETGLFVA